MGNCDHSCDPATQSSDAAESDHACEGTHHHGLTSAGKLNSVSDARLLWSVLLNQFLTVAQVIAGLLSGSVALLSDAAHNFSDANSLLIAYIARRIARREANQRYTFGYRRAELIGATINLTLLGVVGCYLIYEAVHRFFDPQPIIGWLMAVAAGIALAVDLGTALLLWAMSKGSLNVRAAFIHNLVDAAGSVAVLIGAAAVIYLDWLWVDPLLTLLIAAYILLQVARMLPEAARILMEGAPANFPFDEMIAAVRSIDGVIGIHHVHLWELDETHRALEAHVVMEPSRFEDMETIKHGIKTYLSDEHNIRHSTLEFEFANTFDCHGPDAEVIHIACP
ncbi:cation diffusion facilitator family transporter [Rhodopirellula halodulae]|uniref:cation diffusion facilitator family transporter n=1 Tax=Rhodopirellula halodulae TaxID=2894198 RepID=UPI001E606247|nr:cation diffusion facilitator family transporter [Rhodopirellula sp. JC737]MCC9657044.1 cation diffusion facilitator family transporter [Rhodopirellula sp. JC737]